MPSSTRTWSSAMTIRIVSLMKIPSHGDVGAAPRDRFDREVSSDDLGSLLHPDHTVALAYSEKWIDPAAIGVAAEVPASTL